MTDLNTALVKQFLHVPVAQWKAMVQPNRVLNDGHRETVAVQLQVGHSGSAYPDLVRTTQLCIELLQLSCWTDLRTPQLRMLITL